MTGARRQLLVAAVVALVPAAAALADVAGPDDSTAQAYGPLQPGVTVSGSFTRPDDVDYLSFNVAAPNTAVHFVVSNTTGSCGSPDGAIGCAVWGTLIDGQQQQLGGEGSSAGTGEVDAGGTDAIDWVIAQPGTYYLVMDSGGYLPAYKVRLGPASALNPIAKLSASSARHGKAVRVKLKTGRSLRSLTAKLTMKQGRGVLAVARRTLNDLPAGSSAFTLTINAAGRRALAAAANHRLRLRLRVTATPRSGASATATRSLTLHR